MVSCESGFDVSKLVHWKLKVSVLWPFLKELQWSFGWAHQIGACWSFIYRHFCQEMMIRPLPPLDIHNLNRHLSSPSAWVLLGMSLHQVWSRQCGGNSQSGAPASSLEELPFLSLPLLGHVRSLSGLNANARSHSTPWWFPLHDHLLAQ